MVDATREEARDNAGRRALRFSLLSRWEIGRRTGNYSFCETSEFKLFCAPRGLVGSDCKLKG